MLWYGAKCCGVARDDCATLKAMSRGPGRWQREALAALEQEQDLQFGEIVARLNATTRSDSVALRRALDRLVATGRLGRRAGKRMFGGARDIVWFRL